MCKLTIGADIELFLKKDNKYISAEGLIGGTKENPMPISAMGHALQEDNVMCEFNIPPSSDCDKFVSDINFVKDHLAEKLKKINCIMDISSSCIMDHQYLNTDQAKTFGCDPDIDAWTGEENKINTDQVGCMRTCGGHIHLGYDKEMYPGAESKLIQSMDLFLGVPSILIDNDDQRRKIYGKAGAYRIKSYGVEYRTLSNFWIKSDELIRWAFNNVIRAFNYIILEDGRIFGANDVRECINNSDKQLAQQIINEVKNTNKNVHSFG